MPKITVTLNQIHQFHPCPEGWRKLLRAVGKTEPDDEPFPLSVGLDSNGLADVFWALKALPQHDNLWRRYAVWCVGQVRHLMTDQRSLDALGVFERYAMGDATGDELAAARDATWDAAQDATRTARRAAAWPAPPSPARDAALEAARDAAWAAAGAARVPAWDAVDAAGFAAETAAWKAVGRDGLYAARAAQENKLRLILDVGEWVEKTP